MKYKKFFVSSAAAIAVLLIVSFITGRKLADDEIKQDTSSSDASSETSKSIITPIRVEADTDGERVYGGDILYHRDGLTVQLVESDFESSYSALRIKFINETDRDMVMQTDYVTVNGISSGTGTLAIVAAGETADRTIIGMKKWLSEGETVDDIIIKFNFSDNDDSSVSISSEPIKLIYHEAEHSYSAPVGAELIMENDNIRAYYCGQEILTDEDSGEKSLAIYMYYENVGGEDVGLTCGRTDAMFGEESEMCISLMFEDLPAGTVAYSDISLKCYSGEDISLADSVELTFLTYGEDYSRLDETEPITIAIDK